MYLSGLSVLQSSRQSAQTGASSVASYGPTRAHRRARLKLRLEKEREEVQTVCERDGERVRLDVHMSAEGG